MLNIHFKNQTSITGCIIEFEYPYGEKTVQDIIRDMHQNAERNILAIQTVKSLPGPFGLQCYSSITDINEKETMQLWYARNVNNCNLIEIPLSVSDHLVLGENIVFNFVESVNLLHVKKEMENCLPASFQFWAIPDI